VPNLMINRWRFWPQSVFPALKRERHPGDINWFGRHLMVRSISLKAEKGTPSHLPGHSHAAHKPHAANSIIRPQRLR